VRWTFPRSRCSRSSARTRQRLVGGHAATDAAGFLRTDRTLTPEDLGEGWEALGREPLPFETSQPGLFAVGDVRSGSVKRVASAVGEGSAAYPVGARTPVVPDLTDGGKDNRMVSGFTRGFRGRGKNRDPRLPPGQYDTGKSWPTLTAEATPKLDTES